MPLIACPDCGAQVSDTAIVCPRCGFPLRRDVLARAAAGRGGGASARNTAGIIIGLAVAGLVGIVIVGILAALAIPRFTQASDRAKEREGVELLKQVYVLESMYYANNGAYAPTLDELKSVGWQPQQTLYYDVEIRLGPGERDICVEARTRRGTDVQPLSIDSAGVIYHDEGCTGETLAQSRSVGYQPVPTEDVPGESGDAGARTLLREVYAGIAEYRARNGRDPASLGDVLTKVHFTRASSENDLSLTTSHGGFCVSSVPKLPGPGRHELSIDGDGRMYLGGTCSGAVLEQVHPASPPPPP
ncbi:MAG: zinc-ribbon domain-containing protein [Longimicrobiaceae bacterium]